MIFVCCVARPQYLYVIQMSAPGPQLDSEASTYSRPLLSSWTFLSRRIVPTILSPSLSRDSPIGLPRAGNYRFAGSDPDRHQRDDSGAIETQRGMDTYLPRISTTRISCSLLLHPIAGTTNNDSICPKTHVPPLEHLPS